MIPHGYFVSKMVDTAGKIVSLRNFWGGGGLLVAFGSLFL